MSRTATPTLPRILVIDDSALIRKAFTKVLSTEYAVTAAKDGLEALEILKKDRHFDVIITDLAMPRLDGFGVIKAIRSSRSEALKALPIIVVTGQADSNEVKLQCLDLGATDFLTKPFSAADLLARCRSHTEHRKTAKTLQVVQKQVARDPVTGLVGKKLFDIQLEKDLSHVRRHGEPMAMMLVEIIDAKALWAELGEARSHSLLKMVASLLGKAIRKEDTLGRLGEGVFALSLPTARPEGAADLGRRMLAALQGIRLKNKGKPVEFSVALGICTMEAGHIPALSDTLYKAVKAALQQARQQAGAPLYVSHYQPEKTDGKGKPGGKHTAPATKAPVKLAVKLPAGARGPEAEPPLPSLPAIKPAAKAAASVDQVLDRLARGEAGKAELAEALKRIRPLLKLLTPEQRAALLK